MTPLLAHEVGHVAEDRLLKVLSGQVDQAALQHELEARSLEGGASHPLAWKQRLTDWSKELLCDAVAADLMGPSLLWALATILPAPSPGSTGTHPFPSYRVHSVMDLLRDRGWDRLLASTPGATAWLDQIARSGAEREPHSPEEGFLHAAIRIIEPSIHSASKEIISGIDSANFYESMDQLEQYLDAGIPPTEIGGESSDPWSIILACWTYQIRRYGDSPDAIVRASADGQVNAFTTKSIELAGVATLWRRD